MLSRRVEEKMRRGGWVDGWMDGWMGESVRAGKVMTARVGEWERERDSVSDVSCVCRAGLVREGWGVGGLGWWVVHAWMHGCMGMGYRGSGEEGCSHVGGCAVVPVVGTGVVVMMMGGDGDGDGDGDGVTTRWWWW